MRILVTGAAGFIGSSLVDRLLAEGHEVVGFDNFSTGQPEFIEHALTSSRFTLVRGDVLDPDVLTRAMEGIEFVFHLAANADVRFGPLDPRRDLKQNTIGTSNVLEAMRAGRVRRIAFASTGSVYGEAEVFPTPENAPLPVQTSFYGASKLAAEGLITAYAEAFDFQGYIFRFVSILGERYTHGHVFDFYRQLLDHPGTLTALGDGKQRKSYLYVQDCIDAMLLAVEKAPQHVNIFNLGADEYCAVNESIGWITEHLGLSPRVSYGGGERGWVGDSPYIFLDCSRIRGLGWRPKLGIREAILSTLRFLQCSPWLLERRR
ncbi:MAG: NAD-dependent epimerase/dehydratase family protein [Planctomycetota bacterium]